MSQIRPDGVNRWTTVVISIVITAALMPLIIPIGSWILAGLIADKRGQHRIAKT
jgi:hypothetical protein